MLQLLRAIAANNISAGQDNHNGRNGCRGRNGCGGNGGRGNQNRVNRRTPDAATFNRRIINVYYYIHGAYNHGSADCTSKVPGYVDQDTMNNCMGGYNAFCAE